jgi:hypothetical protein
LDPDQASARYIARFQAEAWVRDQAIPVDAQGPTEWDCTGFVDEARLAYLTRLADRQGENLEDPVNGVLDSDDLFKDDPGAPEWVREWRGPFTIRMIAAPEEHAAREEQGT